MSGYYIKCLTRCTTNSLCNLYALLLLISFVSHDDIFDIFLMMASLFIFLHTQAHFLEKKFFWTFVFYHWRKYSHSNMKLAKQVYFGTFCFVCMNCECYLALECVPKSPWPTAFEKWKIHQPNLEKLQIWGSKIEAFLLVFEENAENRAEY